MTEIGGLLDPVGRLWGASAGMAFLALVPDKNIVRGRWVRVVLSLVALLGALIVTTYAANARVLFWESVVPSALIHTAIFFCLGRIGSALGQRIFKKAQNPADASQTSGDDS
jgi:hypothetical protein